MSSYSSAGVLVVSPRGRILCVERRDGRGLGLPFGKEEDGDPGCLDTAIRGCREETGYVVAPVTDEPFVSEDRYCYKATICGRTLPRCNEGAIKWVFPDRFIQRASHPQYAEDVLRYFGVLPPPTWVSVDDGLPPDGEDVLIRVLSEGQAIYTRASLVTRVRDPEFGYFAIAKRKGKQVLSPRQIDEMRRIDLNDPNNYVPSYWVTFGPGWAEERHALKAVTHWMCIG